MEERGSQVLDLVDEHAHPESNLSILVYITTQDLIHIISRRTFHDSNMCHLLGMSGFSDGKDLMFSTKTNSWETNKLTYLPSERCGLRHQRQISRKTDIAIKHVSDSTAADLSSFAFG